MLYLHWPIFWTGWTVSVLCWTCTVISWPNMLISALSLFCRYIFRTVLFILCYSIRLTINGPVALWIFWPNMSIHKLSKSFINMLSQYNHVVRQTRQLMKYHPSNPILWPVSLVTWMDFTFYLTWKLTRKCTEWSVVQNKCSVLPVTWIDWTYKVYWSYTKMIFRILCIPSLVFLTHWLDRGKCQLG